MNYKIKLFFDGSCAGNPGPSGSGWNIIIYDNHGRVFKNIKKYKYVGKYTNNESEYISLINGLRDTFNQKNILINDYFNNKEDSDSEKEEDNIHIDTEVYGDSQLVIYHMLGKYKVNAENLKKYYNEAKFIAIQIGDIKFNHILREYNTIADELSKMALNKKF